MNIPITFAPDRPFRPRCNRRRPLCITLLSRLVQALRGQRRLTLAEVQPVRGEI